MEKRFISIEESLFTIPKMKFELTQREPQTERVIFHKLLKMDAEWMLVCDLSLVAPTTELKGYSSLFCGSASCMNTCVRQRHPAGRFFTGLNCL